MATDVNNNPNVFTQQVSTDQFFSDSVGRIWNPRGNVGDAVFIGNAATGELSVRPATAIANLFESIQERDSLVLLNGAIVYSIETGASNGRRYTYSAAGPTFTQAGTVTDDYVSGVRLIDINTRKTALVTDAGGLLKVADAGSTSPAPNTVASRDADGSCEFNSVVLRSPNGTRWRVNIQNGGGGINIVAA